MPRRGFPNPSNRQTYYYGLGDSPGRADRYNQYVRIQNSDCMGYTCGPESSGNPGYKQWPVYHCLVKEGDGKKGCYGVYYDTGSRGTVDFGTTVSAYRGFHNTAKFECPELEYYFVIGDTPAEVSRGISKLIGTPMMPTMWSVGEYNASSMLYADTDDIPGAVRDFKGKARGFGVGVGGVYLSSGYTAMDVEGEGYVRCVFNWCEERVGKPEELFEANKDTP
eukprot:CAMPEP_0118633558 /NCGR_PEP_ID=MMETSP0785-20121206/1063_1 /TAXON_ID=91992 /ORGANISM="Bolidomonas pacifica, Strain CCMP 1866" /LENGTH=221 /DNA_ID=CAMNT_0006524445 /DNA_START=503 /DNA_END=1164 /DNA_ORIENTATION=-